MNPQLRNLLQDYQTLWREEFDELLYLKVHKGDDIDADTYDYYVQLAKMADHLLQATNILPSHIQDAWYVIYRAAVVHFTSNDPEQDQ